MAKVRKVFLSCLIISLLILTSIILSKILSPQLIGVSNSATTQIGGQSVYFISANQFKNQSDAENLSTQITELGGAGYIFNFDKNFHVITSLYINKDDANKVCNKLKDKYTNAHVLKLSMKKTKINDKALAKEINSLINSIITFYANNFILLDKGEISVNKILINTIAINSQIDSLNETLYLQTDETLIKIRVLLKTLKSNMQLLSDNSSFNQFFKYIGVNSASTIYLTLNKL